MLVWVANENEELRLPEVRKEVCGTLLAVVSHANMAKNRCHIFFRPQEGQGGGHRRGHEDARLGAEGDLTAKDQVGEVHPGGDTNYPYCSKW